jgi:hypothetical protein
MKTTIQELIDLIKEMQKRKVFFTEKGLLIFLEDSLEKEKKQIVDAFEEGVKYESDLLGKVDYPAKRYFNFTYKKK